MCGYLLWVCMCVCVGMYVCVGVYCGYVWVRMCGCGYVADTLTVSSNPA